MILAPYNSSFMVLENRNALSSDFQAVVTEFGLRMIIFDNHIMVSAPAILAIITISPMPRYR